MAGLFSQAINKINSKRAPGTTRARKALQVLQVSANDENLLLNSSEMPRQKEKKPLEPSGETLKMSKEDICGSKEHLVRRSKRKNVLQNESKELHKEDNQSKSKLPKSTKVKKAPKGKKVKNEQVNSNQSSLDSYISVDTKSTEVSMPITEDMASEISIFTDNSIENTVIAEETTMRVIRSTSDEADMLYSDVSSNITYWKMLAEQRQKSIEITLNENSLLKDELEVLEIENSQLKQTLREVEKYIEIINGSLE